jgi:hypothetical protein
VACTGVAAVIPRPAFLVGINGRSGLGFVHTPVQVRFWTTACPNFQEEDQEDYFFLSDRYETLDVFDDESFLFNIVLDEIIKAYREAENPLDEDQELNRQWL